MFDQVKDLYLDGLLAHIEKSFSEAEFVAAFGILGVKAATLPDGVTCAHLRTLVEKFCLHVNNVVEEEVSIFHLIVNIIKQEDELRMELQ